VPLGSLIFDRSGNLYGTTSAGGSAPACVSAGGCGTVFEISQNPDGSWTNTVLYSFCSNFVNNFCLDGQDPVAGLVFDSAGNLYGTTKGGGSQSCSNGLTGCGIAFELSPPSSPGGAWTETALYSFCANDVNGACLDGAEPASQLAIDASGNLFGTTTTGGTGGTRNDCCAGGTVFEMSRAVGGWTHNVLYNFCATGGTICPDGAGPQAGVIFDKAGNLYGTTESGGSTKGQGAGTVYELLHGTNGWTETVLYSPRLCCNGGAGPVGTVSFDVLGSLYTTFPFGGPDNVGGVFKLSSAGVPSAFLFNGKDGQMPMAGVLVDSKHATLYGTTYAGGAKNGGTVFNIAAPAQETVLYSFCSQPNCADGSGPVAGLVRQVGKSIRGHEAGRHQRRWSCF
jgi:uncharacterized repeat protein (TIGR03803 family)